MFRLLFVLSICLFSLQTKAQFNFGVGYSMGYTNPEIDKGIFKQYNNDRPWLEDKLEPINSIQGIHLSLRYRWEFVGFEFSWRNRFRAKRAEGIDPDTDATFQQKVNHRFVNYSLGLENFIGSLSYGGSIDVENFALRTEVTGTDGRYSIINKYGLGSHFFIAYNLDAGPGLTFSIRPYVQIPWTRYNLDPVALELIGDSSPADRNENYMNFGIMFVFYNGQK